MNPSGWAPGHRTKVASQLESTQFLHDQTMSQRIDAGVVTLMTVDKCLTMTGYGILESLQLFQVLQGENQPLAVACLDDERGFGILEALSVLYRNTSYLL